MSRIDKFKGVIPAFFACYDESGEVSPERVRAFTQFLIDKGVNGLYVNGSSGECIYMTKEERMLVLENVMAVAKGKITVIAHIAALSTRESVELAKHAEKCGADALAALPPYYFTLPEYAVEQYWKAMFDATDLPFIIYNIPGTTQFTLSMNLFNKMRTYDKVIGVKNSSMPTQDIQKFKSAGGEDFVVFNGPDEQFISGRVIGAVHTVLCPSCSWRRMRRWKTGISEKPEIFRTRSTRSSTQWFPAKVICILSRKRSCGIRELISGRHGSRCLRSPKKMFRLLIGAQK